MANVRKGFSLKGSVVVRLIVIGILMLGLMIPLVMVDGVVRERQARQAGAEEQVAGSWGHPQKIVGPVLSIPYERVWEDDDGDLHRMVAGQTYVLPASLEVTGTLEPEVRNLGIFEVVVYRTRLKLRGRFEPPDPRLWQRASDPPLWRDAVVAIGIPDLRGIQPDATLNWNGNPQALQPGTGGVAFLPSGVHLPVEGLSALPSSQTVDFEVDLVLNGSRELEVVPVGKSTDVKLASSWADPAFVGAFLPVERTVTEEGFSARWEVSYLGRGYPEAWRSEDESAAAHQSAVTASALGVELLRLVDGYRMTERSTKYAILFILVTFTTFFLFEILQPFTLHPLHYLLVGFALCVFYLLLLSLSELLPFGVAYGLASVATVGLICGYASTILRRRSRGLVTGAVLAGLYGYLYVLLQLRDLALLLGSLGLFALLATVMWLTRHVDWNGLRLGSGTGSGGALKAEAEEPAPA